jgi:hypothetical protein
MSSNPNKVQVMVRKRERTLLPQHTSLGGEIHLANAALQDLYDLVELGTPVIISARPWAHSRPMPDP